MLSLVNITKSYGKKEVLKGVSFKVEKGEFVGIIGKNGAGKTTLVNIICNLLKRDGGIISYGFEEGELYSKIGVQTQMCEFDERLKVVDMLELWQSIYNVDENRIEELLKRFELSDVKKQFIKTLSGGQKQKLNILLALINNPEIIILDELTTSLDAVSRYEMRKYLLELNREGKTILMVSHYMDEVEELCERVIVLKDGVVVENRAPEELIDNKYKDLQEYFVVNM